MLENVIRRDTIFKIFFCGLLPGTSVWLTIRSMWNPPGGKQSCTGEARCSMNLHSKQEFDLLRPLHIAVLREGSSLPLEEAGNGCLSVGFAQSTRPFLGSLSFLFGLFLYS